MEGNQEVPSQVEQGGSPEPVPSMHTSSTNAIVSLSPSKVSKVIVPREELDVAIQGVDIKTGDVVDVDFAGNITDPVFETLVPLEMDISKEIPYSTSRSTNFSHFDISSKHLKARSNKWLLDDTHKDDDLVWVNVTIKSAKSLLEEEFLMDEINKASWNTLCGNISPYSTSRELIRPNCPQTFVQIVFVSFQMFGRIHYNIWTKNKQMKEQENSLGRSPITTKDEQLNNKQ